MSLSQPTASDTRNSPSHSLLHRIVAVDVAAAVYSLSVDSSGNVAIATGTKLFLDSVLGVGGDTYIHETAANNIAVVVGGASVLTASSTAVDLITGSTIGSAYIYRAAGTDVPVTDGGTGSSTAAGAATNLGVGTGDSPQFTAVNIGHATDTTLARVSAGVLAIEGVTILTTATGYAVGGTDVAVADGGTGASTLTGILKGNGTSAFTTVTAPSGTIVGTTDTQTLTNKRETKRVYSTTTLTTLTPEIDTYDIFHLTALASALTIANHSTSTPTDGEIIKIRLLDNGTSRELTWGTAYVAKAGTSLPTTTTSSKNIEIVFEYNSNLAKWNLMAVGLEA